MSRHAELDLETLEGDRTGCLRAGARVGWHHYGWWDGIEKNNASFGTAFLASNAFKVS
jgi:hypothetical protein